MSRARDLANLGADTTNLEDISSAYSAGALSNRNVIINGAMQVAQRGTSVSGDCWVSDASPVDRWRCQIFWLHRSPIQRRRRVARGQTDVSLTNLKITTPCWLRGRRQ
jgi:hypothetical protein